MAKRDSRTARSNTGSTGANVPGTTTADTLEQRVVAFAEQLGRIAGTVQGRAEGWMDRETLNQQIASVRDGAVELLAQLGSGATQLSRKAVKKVAKKKPAPATVTGKKAGSRGLVDAPGKKHRKPLPSDPGGTIVDSQAAKMRAAMPMTKTKRLRGRG